MTATTVPRGEQPTAAAGRVERVRLDLEGMTCASCATRIERKLNRLGGVEATVNYAAETASVAFDPSTRTVDDLLAAVAAAGYRATVEGAAAAEREDAILALRRRLLAAAALTAPLVLLAMVTPLQFPG